MNVEQESIVPFSLAIMQPYFLPYIGYFQLIAAVDELVMYDNIKYTKKGWINRNRFLLNGSESTFTLPLQSASDNLKVVERNLAEVFNRKKLLNQLCSAYAKAPHLDSVFPLIERIVGHTDNNLFRYILHSVKQVCAHIGITTPISTSSTIKINHDLRAQEKVLALCKACGTQTYINPIGGTELYDREVFTAAGVKLKFIKARPFEYPQFGSEFVPWLSIVDVLMFNQLDQVQAVVFKGYELT